ncbi:putative rRNA maturation factor YbeY [Orientia chuto str. Dubai]|uniref:Endoribonuclease YbeY n=1 Tax=Orientia chuto str. Dubai TaxID=1359168 RepID=A0A0F3MLL4_9RICK|nr:rRNA maturation RNase YbeY [Candidatus Orientia mediorientalis]KJV56648.1 putative rRNA maturation factor YbeY [Orientia chuto str. Dubai]
MKIKVDIIKQALIWQNCKKINSSYIKKIVKTTLSHPVFTRFQSVQQVKIVILLTNDREIQSLNFNHRGVNKPTNVLSFPDQVIDWRNLSTLEIKSNSIYLGDIAFGYETILLESKEQKKSFVNHFSHLLIHAILHLLGFDHQYENEAIIMEKLEISLLAQFSIASPY